jgi:hypothetical protein
VDARESRASACGRPRPEPWPFRHVFSLSANVTWLINQTYKLVSNLSPEHDWTVHIINDSILHCYPLPAYATKLRLVIISFCDNRLSSPAHGILGFNRQKWTRDSEESPLTNFIGRLFRKVIRQSLRGLDEAKSSKFVRISHTETVRVRQKLSRPQT